jgi:hypothetical protein
MNDTYLDRFLKQRSALHEPDIPFDLPPQRGGYRSLSGATVCFAAEVLNSSRTSIRNPTNS